MVRKSGAAAGVKKPATGRKLLALAREHQNALMAAGLSSATLDRLENALKGLGGGKQPNPAAQVLIKDVLRGAGEVQGAIRKEFPGNVSFQRIFKADEPLPAEPRAVLALGRLIAKEAPDFGTNLIKHAINGASVKHLGFLCDQLEKELGGADPKTDAKEAEEQIVEVARRAFEGKPELSQFEG
jgi:hypothetical protein